MEEKIFLKHKLKRYNNKQEYLIDTKLRAFLLEILEHIENSLKQSFINEIGENYDNINFYRVFFKDDVKIFINEKVKYLKKNNEECLRIQGKISSNIFISKLTFGEISHLLRKLELKNKKNILKTFGFYKIKYFENWISNMRYLRNLVCHGENIFNKKFEKKIDFYKTTKDNNNFKGYFLILGVFCKILGIEDKIQKIGKFLQKKIDAPGVKHISKEIEAWYVLVDTLYDFYVKKSNLKGEKIQISVIMPVYNTEKYVAEAIESILSQSFSDFEFIIIDDCSTDGSYEICKKYAKKYSRIKLFRNERNRGISYTRNKLISLTKTTYIASQDSDDVSLKDRLKLSFEFLETNKDYAVVSGNNIIIDETGKEIGYRKYSDNIENIILKKSPISQPSSMFRKDVFLEVGGYDKNLNYGEDYDLWCKIFAKGYKIKNLGKNLIKLRIREGQTKSSKLKQTIKNTIFIQRRANKEYLIKTNFSDKIYLFLENILLYLPSSLVMYLFKKLEYRKGKN